MLDSLTLPGLKLSFLVLYFLPLSHPVGCKVPKTLSNGGTTQVLGDGPAGPGKQTHISTGGLRKGGLQELIGQSLGFSASGLLRALNMFLGRACPRRGPLGALPTLTDPKNTLPLLRHIWGD